MRRRFSSLRPTAPLSWRQHSNNRRCWGSAGYSRKSPFGRCNKAKNRAGNGPTICYGSAKRSGSPRRCTAKQPFDLVHHLTWAGVRAPTFLGALGVPLIIGPVGGGETSPGKLRDGFPFRGRVLESVRDFSNATIELNPIVRLGLRNAGVIFARTADTKNLLSPTLRAKTYVQMELGVTPAQIGTPRPLRQMPRKLLYAGRLLYWKGVHIAIEAMSRLVAHMPDAHLTIVGNGPEETRLKSEIAQRNLEANIKLAPWMPQEQFLHLYDTNDVFVFPSLHDSAGWVVLESLCRGLPVACLNLGGPKDIVTPAVRDHRRYDGAGYIRRRREFGSGALCASC